MNTDQSTEESDNKSNKAAEKSCCGGSAITREDACCQADEKIKNLGGTGCGCVCSSPKDT